MKKGQKIVSVAACLILILSHVAVSTIREQRKEQIKEQKKQEQISLLENASSYLYSKFGNTTDVDESDEPETTVTASDEDRSASARAKLVTKQIIGTWMDSAGLAGYTFSENGICKVFLSSSDIGTEGNYTIERRDDGNDYMVLTYSLPVTGIQTTQYMVSVKEDTLTLISVEDAVETVYYRQTP